MKHVLAILHGAVYIVIMYLLYDLRNMGMSTEYREFNGTVLLLLLLLTIGLQAIIVIRLRNRIWPAIALQAIVFLFILCLYSQSTVYIEGSMRDEVDWLNIGLLAAAELALLLLAAYLWRRMRLRR
ncbi:hypothetical protein PAECIP111893_01849 [Paenibacillus plantiphilus]|uniref:Uncharacterized protein n=1 Tax=Paenibacillus plantiphilus TaxID=2905650 RepID=A0ABM9C2W6_9BACL|nr:hypothetical protein [Paenibacillus plantiphilus]CAH1202609.1 hypothetical protein PAECIP111893_01849 [Paenibacillus plantiphilus]